MMDPAFGYERLTRITSGAMTSCMSETHDGRAFRLLTLLGECLAIEVQRQMNHQDVLDRLAELFVDRGVPEYIRSDNGSEFTAQAVRDWLKAVGVRTLYIEPGSPWENVRTALTN